MNLIFADVLLNHRFVSAQDVCDTSGSGDLGSANVQLLQQDFDLKFGKTDVTSRSALTEVVREVHYINLDASLDRRKSMEEQLKGFSKATGLSYRRFPAVLGAKDPFCIDYMKGPMMEDPRYQRGLGGGLTYGSIDITMGCRQSHIRLWNEIYANESLADSSVPFVIVLEDDAQIPQNALDEPPRRSEHIPNDADMILLGCAGGVRYDDEIAEGVYRATGPEFDVAGYNTTSGPYWENTVFYGCTYAYMLRISSIPRMVAHLESAWAPSLAIDIGTAYNASALRKYALFPTLLNTVENLSDWSTRYSLKEQGLRGDTSDNTH